MAIMKVELMHECSSKHLRKETAIMKEDIETEEEGETRKVNMERSTAGRKKTCPAGVATPRNSR